MLNSCMYLFIYIHIYIYVCTLVPMTVLQKGLSRNILYCAHWTERRKRRALSRWRVRAVVVWLICAAYLSCILSFMASFLASVSPKDGMKI